MSKIKNSKLLILDDKTNTLSEQRIDIISSDGIETKNSIYNSKDVVKYHNETTGEMYYLAHADIQARQESENLKKLRRSVALNNMFNYQTKQKLDMFKLMPYVIIIVMVLFL